MPRVGRQCRAKGFSRAIHEIPAATPMSHSRVQNARQVDPGIYVANTSTSIFLISKAGDSWG